MTKTKREITNEITAYLKSEIETCDDQTIQKLFKKDDYKVLDYFHNEDSLRLRAAGYQILRQFFDSQEFEHDRNFYTGEILTIAKTMNAPFYINLNKIVLFNKEQIVLCKLSGSVTSWLENIS